MKRLSLTALAVLFAAACGHDNPPGHGAASQVTLASSAVSRGSIVSINEG